MSIPFFRVAREYARYRDAYLDRIDSVLKTGRVLQGPPVPELEGRLAALAGRKEAVAVGSCTDALTFALMALRIGPGDEVLVPGLSFFASASAIVRVGATPCFVDVEAETGLMDMDALKAAVGPKTRAILAVHLYGQTLDMAAVEAVAAGTI